MMDGQTEVGQMARHGISSCDYVSSGAKMCNIRPSNEES